MLQQYGSVVVDDKEIAFIQTTNGVITIKLKDGQVLTTTKAGPFPSTLGEAAILSCLAERLDRSPLFNLSRPLGLKLPKG